MRAASAALVGEELALALNALRRSIAATPDVQAPQDVLRIRRETKLAERLGRALEGN